jgi:O-acetyl-ADP-ribose deacetylase (regulator of RNase III)
MKVEFQKGDITEADVDAIVNAANTNLLLGAGVAGAIRRKGGPAIQQECDRLGPVSLGEAAITGGGLLKARHVIHAAAMHLGGDVTAASCEAATVNSLRRAGESSLKSVAFPAIGTGVGGLDMETCARTMLGAVRRFPPASVERVVFVLYDGGALATFQRVWEELGN